MEDPQGTLFKLWFRWETLVWKGSFAWRRELPNGMIERTRNFLPRNFSSVTVSRKLLPSISLDGRVVMPSSIIPQNCHWRLDLGGWPRVSILSFIVRLLLFNKLPKQYRVLSHTHRDTAQWTRKRQVKPKQPTPPSPHDFSLQKNVRKKTKSHGHHHHRPTGALVVVERWNETNFCLN